MIGQDILVGIFFFALITS